MVELHVFIDGRTYTCVAGVEEVVELIATLPANAVYRTVYQGKDVNL